MTENKYGKGGYIQQRPNIYVTYFLNDNNKLDENTLTRHISVHSKTKINIHNQQWTFFYKDGLLLGYTA